MLQRRPSMIAVAIPAIVTAAAVYIALVFVNKLTGRFFAPVAPQEPTVRPVNSVVKPPPVLEQTPPPSPELVAERYRRDHAVATELPAEPEVPILVPELEVTPLELQPLPLEPLIIQVGDVPAMPPEGGATAVNSDGTN